MTAIGPWAGSTGRLGADTVALDELAVEMAAAANWLRSMRWNRMSPIDSALAEWEGPDAARVMQQLAGIAAARRSTATALDEAAARLRRAAIEQRQASRAEPATTVLVDTVDDGGRLIQRVGDRTASTVVVLVPGATSDRGDRDRLRADAMRVWASLSDRVERPESVAVLSWLGYDPPDSVVGALDVAAADDGAEGLVAAVAALRSDGARRVVVVGHSYGGVVAGRAILSGLDADAVVQLGSPGLGAPGVAEAARSRGIELHAARAVGDPIGAVAGHFPGLYGDDALARAGVDVLDTSGRGHSSYLVDDVVLGQLSQIAAGPAR